MLINLVTTSNFEDEIFDISAVTQILYSDTTYWEHDGRFI